MRERARRSSSTPTPTPSTSGRPLELTKRGLTFEPQRYKGLGEMDADQLADTTMSPRHRTLRRMTVDDGLIAETTFEMLMGNDARPSQGLHH